MQKVKVTYDMRQTINSLFSSHYFFNRFKGFQCMSWDHFCSFFCLTRHLLEKIKDFKKFERLLLKKLNRKLIKNTKYYQKNHFSFYTDGLLWNKSFIFPYLEWVNLYSFNVDFNYCEYFLFVSVDRLFF